MDINGETTIGIPEDLEIKSIVVDDSFTLSGKYVLPTTKPSTNNVILASANTTPDGAVLCEWGVELGGGDVVGNSVPTIDNEIVLYDGTSGKAIKTSNILISNITRNPMTSNLDANFNDVFNVATLQANVFAGVDMDLRRDDQTGIAGINFSTQDQTPIPRWFLGTDVGNDNLVILNNTADRNVSFSQDGNVKITHTGDTATQEFKDSDLIFNVGSNVNADAPSLEFKRAGGTLSTPTAVGPTKGPLGRINALGYDGVSYDFGISMVFETRQADWTPTSHPASLSIFSTDFGGTTPTEKLRVDYFGIGIGEGEGVSANGYLLPLTRGTSGQVLKLGANGFVSWADDGGGGETFQDVYANSITTPQITTNITNGPIEIQQGVGASNDLIRIKDSAGTDVGSISTDGFYTENGLYIGTPSSYNITKETGNIFQIAESGQDPFILYAPQNLFLNKTGLGNTQVEGGTLIVNTLFQINQLANNSSIDGVNNIYRRSRGTTATPLAVLTGDELSRAEYRGYDSVSYQNGAVIRTTAEENWTGVSHGGSLSISTTTIGTTTEAQRLKVSSAGIEVGETPTSYTLPLTRASGANQVLKDVAGDGNVAWVNQGAWGLQYFQNNLTNSSGITTQNVYVNVSGATRLDGELQDFTTQATTMTYTGVQTRMFQVIFNCNWEADGPQSNLYQLGVHKNGILNGPSQMVGKLDNTLANYPRNVSTNAFITLSTNDTISIRVRNLDGTQDVIISDMIFSVHSIG
jgi:hypothetical protein